MEEYFYNDERVLTKKGGMLKKYVRRLVGSERLSDLLVYEFMELFVMWIPGAIGFVLRNGLFKLLLKQTGGKDYFSHHITIRGGKKITIGRNVFLDSYVTLDVKDITCRGIEIGDNTYIERFCVITTGVGETGCVKVGSNCSIGPGTAIYGQGGVTIGNNVMIAPQGYIVASSHLFHDIDRPICEQGFIAKGVVVEDDVWLGAGVKVLDGVRIGKGSIIGAGAVVNRDIEPYSIAVGIPARVIKKRK